LHFPVGLPRASADAGATNVDSGYYAACAGFAAQSQALELVAHNLANLGTTLPASYEKTFATLAAGEDSASPA